MWPALANAVKAVLPEAIIVHDRFHISQHLTEEVGKVRRRENKELIKHGDHRLKGSRCMWLVNDENLDERFQEAFMAFKHPDLKVARVWAIKGLLGLCNQRLGTPAFQQVVQLDNPQQVGADQESRRHAHAAPGPSAQLL